MQVLFRAKEKNSNNYVIGYEYYNHVEDEYYITHYVSGSNYKVDRTTRSINIEDMIDSQGNKIFASLSEDRKGGDILEYEDLKGTVYIDIFTYSVKADTNQGYLMPHMFINSKVIGIQK